MFLNISITCFTHVSHIWIRRLVFMKILRGFKSHCLLARKLYIVVRRTLVEYLQRKFRSSREIKTFMHVIYWSIEILSAEWMIIFIIFTKGNMKIILESSLFTLEEQLLGWPTLTRNPSFPVILSINFIFFKFQSIWWHFINIFQLVFFLW